MITRYGIALFLLLTLGAPFAASAQQEDGEYSVQEFVRLREQADASYDHFEQLDDDAPDRRDAARTALRERVALLNYLTQWQESGTMPSSLVSSAVESQFVINQNIVKLYAELRLCDDARNAADVMQELMRGQRISPTARQALTEARANVVECETTRAEAQAREARREREQRQAEAAARQQAEREAAARQQAEQLLDERGEKRKTVGIALASSGAATAIGTIVWAAVGSKAVDDRGALIDASCNPQGVCDPAIESDLDAYDSKIRAARWGTVALGVASVSLISAGLVLWLKDPKSDDASGVAQRHDFGVGFSRDGAFARFTTRF